MKVLTSSVLAERGGPIEEPVVGSIVILKMANGHLMAYRHGREAPGMNREYRWWRSDHPGEYSVANTTRGAAPWVEVLRSGEILAVFYP